MYVLGCFVIFLLSFVLNFRELQRLPTKNNLYYTTVLIFLPILVLISPTTLLSFIIFKFYKKIVYYILKLRFGTRFLGFFENQDGLHINCPEGSCTINILLIIESHKIHNTENNLFEIICNLVNQVIIKNGRKLPKFASTVQESMGYFYMKEKSDIDLLKCVKKLKILENCTEITKFDLTQILTDYSTEPLPYNNTLMWDVHVGAQPLKWNDNCSSTHYPVLFRFHHSVADAVNIYEFISGIFGYNPENNHDNLYQTKIFQYQNTKISVPDPMNWFNIFFFMPAMMFSLLIIKQTFSFESKFAPKFKNGRIALHIEKSPKYLEKIKKLRRKYNTTFTSILATAFSATLEDYYLKHKGSIPEYETTIVPFHPKALSMQYLLPGSKSIDDIDFHNRYDVTYLILPISPKMVQLNGNPSKRVELVTKFVKQECNSALHRVFHSYMNLYNTLTPSPMTKLFGTYVKFGPCISSVPASSKIKFACDTLSVSDYMFFVPDSALFSFSLYMTSYDDRLQIALITPAHKYTMDDAEWILDRFLTSINTMEIEST